MREFCERKTGSYDLNVGTVILLTGIKGLKRVFGGDRSNRGGEGEEDTETDSEEENLICF